MNMGLETRLKTALQGIERFRTPGCLSETTIGSYIEKKLDEPLRREVEAHLNGCLHCLKQLNDMTALLHYQKQKAALPQHLRQKLQELLPQQTQDAASQPSFLDRFRATLTFTPSMWRFSALGLSAAWVVFLVSALVLRHEEHLPNFDALHRDSFVRVQALNAAGSVLNEQQGVVIGEGGLIASSLSPLTGASKLRVTLKNGTTYQTDNIWKDEDKNLAVMKINNSTLKAIPVAGIKEIVGKRIYVVADPSTPGNKLQEALASGIKELPNGKKAGPRYIQVATQTTNATKGAVVDEQGRLLGFLITEEKHLNLASTAEDITRLASSAQQIPLSELTQTAFSGYAIDIYMKGILAKDAQRWDDAVECLENAIQLNPRLEGAYVKLGHVYYRKREFTKEAEIYEKVLRINPDNLPALFSLAESQVSMGQYRKAIKSYEKVLALNGTDGEALYQLGLSYMADNQNVKATEMFSRLKTVDPGQAELLGRLIKQR
jgi:TolA-binding protein